MENTSNEQLVNDFAHAVVEHYSMFLNDRLDDAVNEKKKLDALKVELLRRLKTQMCAHCRYDCAKDANCARCGMPKNGDVRVADNIRIITDADVVLSIESKESKPE